MTSTTTTSDHVDDNSDSNNNDTNNNDGGDGDNDDGEVEHDGGDDDDNDNNDGVNIDVVEDDNDDGTTRMRWRQGRMDNDDAAMAMGGQRHAERSQAPRQPSEATINLCRQFGEESMRERDIFGGGDNRKGSRWRRLSGDHFISTQSIPNLPSSHPSAEKGPEPIPHVSWE